MEQLRKLIENPSKEYRCDVRWWLAEGLHTDQTLKAEIGTLADDGFGAAEFLAIDELGADSSRYGWGSEEWVHDTQLIIEETTKNGLGASLTSGTNWSNANLPDFVHMPDDPSAAKELDYALEPLGGGQRRTDPLRQAETDRPNVERQDLVAVVAAKKLGEQDGRPLLDVDTLLLTGEVRDGALDWTAPDGDWLLFTFWVHGTGQVASPSVTTSYTINYIDRYGIDKLVDYWNSEVLTPRLCEYIHKNGRVQMYMDSLELSTYGRAGQFWGLHFCEEFHRRRGYSVEPYLPFVCKVSHALFGPFVYQYACGDAARAEKVQNDLYQTMTDLYIDNMLKPMQGWLHSVGMTLRAEISYGLPFEISQPGKYVDGIETESLEFASQIDSYRGLAGAAHLYNKVFSSETGATLLNYMMGLDFYTQIIYTQFAAGVTKTVLHGYSSICGSEESTYWPGHEGMWPIFSERFGSRQPAYRHYNDWTGMIARYQRVLRSGRPRRDVAILRLDYNFYNLVTAEGLSVGERVLYESMLMRAGKGLYWRDTTMQDAGYSYDYFAPQLLEDPDITFGGGELGPDSAGYRAVVVYQEALPLASAKKLLEYAKKGLPVIFADGLTESVHIGTEKHHAAAALRTPYLDGNDGALAAVIAEMKALPTTRTIDDPATVVEVLQALGVSPRAGFAAPNKQVFTLMREDGKTRYVYVYNYQYTRPDEACFRLCIEGEGVPCRIDCWTGEVEPVGVYDIKDGQTLLDLVLQPGESALYALDLDAPAGLHALATTADAVAVRDGALYAVVAHSGTFTTRLSDGRQLETAVACREDIPLERWQLAVEDWNEGEKRIIEEDRGLGYVTREVCYETEKSTIQAGETPLVPWKNIPAVGPKVSGVGSYTTQVTLPQDWGVGDGAVFCYGGSWGNTVAVYVNGKKAPAVDFDRRQVDITGLLEPGANTLLVEVSSTLNNRLIANGYYQHVLEISATLARAAKGHEKQDEEGGLVNVMSVKPEVQPYGLQGDARLCLYKKVVLADI